LLLHVLQNGSKVIFKRSTWARGPQAVLKDSCLVNTPMENRRAETAQPEPSGEAAPMDCHLFVA
jgi:hypothetical protein